MPWIVIIVNKVEPCVCMVCIVCIYGRQIATETEREGAKYIYINTLYTHIEPRVLLHSSPQTLRDSEKNTHISMIFTYTFHHHVPFVILPHFHSFISNETTLYRIAISDCFCLFYIHHNLCYIWSMRHTHTDWHSMKKKKPTSILKISLFSSCLFRITTFSWYVCIFFFAVLPTWNN